MLRKDESGNALAGYLEAVTRLGNYMSSQQAYLKKTLEPILAQQEQLARQIQSVRAALPDLSWLPEVLAQIGQLQKSLDQLFTPTFQLLQEAAEKLPGRIRAALLDLGEHGWYLDLGMPLPDLWRLTDTLAEGDIDQAEFVLTEYFDRRTDAIEASIAALYPRRQEIVRKAFKAHRNGDYDLAIPVFLAQVDGICKEATNEYLFRKQNKKPAIAKYVEQAVLDSFSKALLSPFSRTLPINATEWDRANTPGDFGFNRHTILHGESLDYGTKTNSLRAISLLNYASHVLSDARSEKH